MEGFWPPEMHAMSWGSRQALELHGQNNRLSSLLSRAHGNSMLSLHPFSLPQALERLEATWGSVEFVFTPHRGGEVQTVKMREEDFEMLEDNQTMVLVRGLGWRQLGAGHVLICGQSDGKLGRGTRR